MCGKPYRVNSLHGFAGARFFRNLPRPFSANEAEFRWNSAQSLPSTIDSQNPKKKSNSVRSYDLSEQW